MKGICKGLNKYISNMFVAKEHEIEIGFPTDVKHVAHIGWDGQSENTAPSWMKEFKTSADFSATTVGVAKDASWPSQDFDQSMGGPGASDGYKDSTPMMKAPKKNKRKKSRSTTSSPRSSSTSKSSRLRSKNPYTEL